MMLKISSLQCGKKQENAGCKILDAEGILTLYSAFLVRAAEECGCTAQKAVYPQMFRNGYIPGGVLMIFFTGTPSICENCWSVCRFKSNTHGWKRL